MEVIKSNAEDFHLLSDHAEADIALFAPQPATLALGDVVAGDEHHVPLPLFADWTQFPRLSYPVLQGCLLLFGVVSLQLAFKVHIGVA